MVMKIKSFWKIVLGIMVSLFASSTVDAKDTVQTNKQATQVDKKEGETKIGLPTEARVTCANPAEAKAVVGSSPAEGTDVWRGLHQRGREAKATCANPAGRGLTIVLPKNLSGKTVPIISSKDANLSKYKNVPVVIVNADGTEYLRIPIAESDEGVLMEEYLKSR